MKKIMGKQGMRKFKHGDDNEVVASDVFSDDNEVVVITSMMEQ